MQRAVPDRAMSSAQGLYYALPLGIGLGVVMSLSGVLVRDYAAHAYFGMAALSAVTLSGALVLHRQWRRDKII